MNVRWIRIAAPLAVIGGALFVASCGGGSNTAPAVVATPSPSPVAASTTIPTGGGTLSAGTVGGLSASFAVAAGAPAGTTISTTSQVGAPSGEPAPSSVQRQAESIAGAVPFFYVVATVSQSVPTNIFTSETLTLSGQPATASFYVEIDDLNNVPIKLVTVPGVVSVAGTTVTFTNSQGTQNGNGESNLVAGHTYVFMFYYVPVATPSPSPTAAASSGTTPIPSAAPTSVATTGVFNSTIVMPVIAGYQQTLTFSPAPNPTGVAVSITAFNYQPNGVPTNPPSSQPSPTATSASVLAAWEFTPIGSGTITVYPPTQTFTGVPPAPQGRAFYTYFADVTPGMSGSNGYGTGNNTGTGQQSVNGTVTFPATGSSTTQLQEGHTYIIELVYF